MKRTKHVENTDVFENLMTWFQKTEHVYMQPAISADRKCLQVVPLQPSIYFTLCGQELWRLFFYGWDCWAGVAVVAEVQLKCLANNVCVSMREVGLGICV